MFHLILTACLVSAPSICETRLLPAGDAAALRDCLTRAVPVATDWLVRHPDLRGKGVRCSPTAGSKALDVTAIADGVYLYQGDMAQLSRQNQGRIANLAFVVGDTVAVIDAGISRAEGEALYTAIRHITDKRISYLILTHMHPDHIFGAEVFSEAGATVVASAHLPEAVARRVPDWMRSIPEQIGMAAFAGTRAASIDQTADAAAVLSLGHRKLLIQPVPAAHTDNDLTVLDRDTGTLFTGDLVFAGLTPSVDGSVRGWLEWLAQDPGTAVQRIVPGHGPVMTDREQATAPTFRYLTALYAAAQGALDHGLPLSQAVPAIVTSMQDQSPGWADFAATTARNAAQAYVEAEWE